ncbi:MAG: methyltransferase [SAR324 cluster bacterium]|nr:methyltransferase [SAR324 cluster bacterium]
MIAPDIKHKIIRNFSLHAREYENHADFQKYSANRFFSRCEPILPLCTQHPVLEIGCGTGFVSEILLSASPDHHLEITDISPAMLRQCQERLLSRQIPINHAKFYQLDGEKLDIGEHYGLILSNLTFQWFLDFSGSLEKLMKALRPGGWLVFSVPGSGCYPEWKQACKELHLSVTANSLPDLTALTKQMQPHSARIHLEQMEYTEWHPSARAFFHSLKAIGAATSLGSVRLSPSEFRRLLEYLDGQASDRGIPVTYELGIFTLQKQA